MYAVHKDRLLRRREYADRIRNAAAETTVGIERTEASAKRGTYPQPMPALELEGHNCGHGHGVAFGVH